MPASAGISHRAGEQEKGEQEKTATPSSRPLAPEDLTAPLRSTALLSPVLVCCNPGPGSGANTLPAGRRNGMGRAPRTSTMAQDLCLFGGTFEPGDHGDLI